MTTETPFTVTEWEFFKLKLEIFSLKHRSDDFRLSFEFDRAFIADEVKMYCDIRTPMTGELLQRKATEAEQLEHYRGWIECEKDGIAKELSVFPVLSKSFDVNSDIAFRIIHVYGMGGTPVCVLRNDEVRWVESYKPST